MIVMFCRSFVTSYVRYVSSQRLYDLIVDNIGIGRHVFSPAMLIALPIYIVKVMFCSLYVLSQQIWL